MGPDKDNKILPFKVVTSEVTPPTGHPQLIKMLEDTLARARTGKIAFCGVAYTNDAGVASITWAPDDKVGPTALTSAMGAIAFLQARFARSVDDGAEYDDEAED